MTLEKALREKGFLPERELYEAKQKLHGLIPSDSWRFAQAREMLSEKFDPGVNLKFRVEISGYGFGNSCSYGDSKSFYGKRDKIPQVEEYFLTHIRQGWAISCEYKITAFNSYWSFCWGGNIPQSERIDTKQKIEEYKEWLKNQVLEFKKNYKHIASRRHVFTYLTSQIDECHPGIPLD